jgi:hypothetical protein
VGTVQAPRPSENRGVVREDACHTGHALASEHFLDVAGPAFKVGGYAPSFLTALRPKVWDFYLPFPSALAARFLRLQRRCRFN